MSILQKMSKSMTDSIWFKLLAHLLFAATYAFAVNYGMYDDGFRHIAFAAHKQIMQSWGSVYPFSLFGPYDPWFAWHAIIDFFLLFVPYESVHIAINGVVIFFVSIWVDIAIRRFVKTDLGVFGIMIAFCVAYLSYRYVNTRPDNLSGLFVMYALLLGDFFWAHMLLSALYSPTYYLFFFYTALVAVVCLITGKKKAFLGVATGSVIGIAAHWLFGGEEFLKTVLYLLTDQKLREGLSVGELNPLFAFLDGMNYTVISLFLLIGALFFGIRYRQKEFFNEIYLFLALSSFMWLLAMRYFALFYPLFFVSIIIFLSDESQRGSVMNYAKNCARFISSSFGEVKNSFAFAVAALLLIGFGLGFSARDDSSKKLLDGYGYFKSEEFNNKTVLLNAMNISQYYALYQNPSIHFIPSCSIGWFDGDAKMRALYIKMQKESGITTDELVELIRYTKADYYFHVFRNFNQTLNIAVLEKNGIKPIVVKTDFLIFKVQKDGI